MLFGQKGKAKTAPLQRRSPVVRVSRSFPWEAEPCLLRKQQVCLSGQTTCEETTLKTVHEEDYCLAILSLSILQFVGSYGSISLQFKLILHMYIVVVVLK